MSLDSIKIRDVKPSDSRFVSALVTSDRKYAEKDPNFGDYLFTKKLAKPQLSERSKNRYKDYSSGNAVYKVAEHDGKVVGYCFVRKKDIPNSELSHVGVLSLRVGKEFRGKGVGTLLMRETLKKCKGRFEIIELNFLAINNVARKLYKKFGFKKWGTGPNFVKRGRKYIDMEYMYLRLK